MKHIPRATTFTSAPLRNRVRADLDAAVSDVWSLVGDLARFPEYSSGLERVEAIKDSNGTLTEYVCHFKPQAEGGEAITHCEFVRWYEPNAGYASSGEEDNAFGLTNDLNMVTLEASKDGTIVTWEVYFDAEDVNANKASFDHALADIAERLIARFGGRLVERYVEETM